jgi:hypothetical protein
MRSMDDGRVGRRRRVWSAVRTRRARGAAAALLSLACASAAGCVADGPQPPPRPEPREIAQPSGLRASRVVLSADPVATDTNGNGFADTFRVTVYLFPPADQHPLPIHQDGTMIFELTSPGGETIRRWELGPERVAAARFRPPVGPGHLFTLSLLDNGTDRLEVSSAVLRCRFVPTDAPGEAIEVNGQATIRLGALRGRGG